MDDLNPDIGLFTKRSGTVVEITPLIVAIQYRHFDIVRFIVEKMNVDIRLSLAIVVIDQDGSKSRPNMSKS